MTDTWLIVGLGNPGAQYHGNRHNVGQMVLDELAARMGAGFKSHKARAQVLEGRLGIGGPRVVLAKPMSYMNVSGGPVAALANFYGITPDHVIAVHDEIDIPFNTVKLKIGGGKAATTGCGTSPRPLPPRTTSASGWGWDGRPDAWKRLTMSFATSAPPSSRNCPSCWMKQQMQWRAWCVTA
jgi:hypothetical protein